MTKEDDLLNDVKKMEVNELIIGTRETCEALNKCKRKDQEGNLPVSLLIRITFLIEELKLRGYAVIPQKSYLIILEEDLEKDESS